MEFVTHLNDGIEDCGRIGGRSVAETLLEQPKAFPIVESIRVKKPGVAGTERGIAGILAEGRSQFLSCGQDLLSLEGKLTPVPLIQYGFIRSGGYRIGRRDVGRGADRG